MRGCTSTVWSWSRPRRSAPPPRPRRSIDRQSQIAQVLQCAEVVGILQTVFDFTVQWALDRYTFGRPLASYQALKHRFADMKMWLEACRATTAAAVSDVAAGSAGAGLSASIAKSYVGEMAGQIVQACVQMHGGIGVTWEHDLHLYLRRVTLYRSMFGTPEEHNLRVFEAEKAHQEATMTESVAEFAARARTWLADNMPAIDPESPPAAPRDEPGPWQRARELQKRLYEGGFAGICFPREYGGLGLDYEYQKAFDEESLNYEMPLILNVPTFAICCATLLDTGSEDQKKQHIAAALRGDEVLVQLLSRTQRRIGSGRCDHPGRPAGRPVGDQRRQDMEHQRVRRRLRIVSGPHQLGCAQTRWPDHVSGAHRASGNHVAAHHACERWLRVLRGVSGRCRRRRRRRGR